MPVTLVRAPVEDLQAIAAGAEPPRLAGFLESFALPPAFVPKRTLEHLAAGKSPSWCCMFYVIDTGTGRVVGTCGFKDEPCDGLVEIGYGIAPSHRARGLATLAVSGLLAEARRLDPEVIVLAQVSGRNLASTRVVQKLAFVAKGSKADVDGEELVQWHGRSEA